MSKPKSDDPTAQVHEVKSQIMAARRAGDVEEEARLMEVLRSLPRTPVETAEDAYAQLF